jgi:magnesium-transporting ATPase (P-type)
MDIPVDGIMIHGSGVQADESAMTGESITLIKENTEKCFQRKDEHEADMKGSEQDPHDVPSCVLLSGTQIQTGEGWFVCIVVGDETCEGQIMASLEKVDLEQTPL